MEGMKNIPDKSIDLIVTDPPYFKIMTKTWDGIKCDWDNQWETLEDYLLWVRSWAVECQRILKDNGSLYVFADDKICAYIQIELDKIFCLVNSIVWVKPNNMTMKGWTGYRSYASITERILFYEQSEAGIPKTGLQSIHNDCNCFIKIKEYMRDERKKCMEFNKFKTIEEFNIYIRKITNTSSVVDRHYFADSQYVFPTKEIYIKMQKTGFWQRPYENEGGLRQEYEGLRREFNASKNYTDVWKFPITSTHESTIHPTQKPLKLIDRIITVSSKKQDVILDLFMGSGTTAVAAIRNNRHFMGFELDPDYYKQACERVDAEIMHEKTKTSILDCW